MSFTIKELRELLKLPGVTSVISEDDFTGVKEQLSKLERPRKRLTELLMKNLGNKADSDSKSWELRLWRTPERIVVDDDGQVTGLECRHSQAGENILTGSQYLLLKQTENLGKLLINNNLLITI